MLFQPLVIRDHTFPSNVIQGPLAGYSCSPFRRLFWRFGGLGFAMSEMIASSHCLKRKVKKNRYLFRDDDEKFCGFQITGNNQKEVAEMTQLVDNAGADLIDLNAGCPVNKVRKKGKGSKLLETPGLLKELLRTIKDNTDLIVSLKIRLAYPANDFSMDAVLDAAEQVGIDLLTVHGRHWTQHYDVSCYQDGIAEVVSKTKIPVIANGDVCDYESLLKLYDHTKCAGVMISRAGVGKPWLFQQLKHQHQGKLFEMPSVKLRGELFKEHLQGLIELDGERSAVLQARKLAKYYARSLRGASDFAMQVQSINEWSPLSELIGSYFDDNNFQPLT